METPSGYEWPRWITYRGDDQGFVRWTEHRATESFEWAPSRAFDVDATAARIGSLAIDVPDAPCRLGVPSGEHARLELRGHIASLVVFGPPPAGVGFSLHSRLARDAEPMPLPRVSGLEKITSISITSSPLRQAVSLRDLYRHYPRLHSIQLHGNLTDLEVLGEYRVLKSLALRFMPRLAGLPPLASFDGLDSFIAWNVIDDAGKELRRKNKIRPLSTGSVSQLRSASWFEAEYGLPFAAWPRAKARAAVNAYRATERAIVGAQHPARAEEAVTAFVASFNGCSDLMTTEREDIGEAVRLLANVAPTLLGAKRAQELFDAARSW